MATHTDTSKLVTYSARSYPNLGNAERYISDEFANIQKSIASIISVMKLLEARMNNAGLP